MNIHWIINLSLLNVFRKVRKKLTELHAILCANILKPQVSPVNGRVSGFRVKTIRNASTSLYLLFLKCGTIIRNYQYNFSLTSEMSAFLNDLTKKREKEDVPRDPNIPLFPSLMIKLNEVLLIFFMSFIYCV